jgi:hypothetical protein
LPKRRRKTGFHLKPLKSHFQLKPPYTPIDPKGL